MTMSNGLEIITGIRPTGALTIANYLGAVKPIVALQEAGRHAMVFVADLHAFTDHEPSIVQRFVPEVVADYLALGLDPAKTPIFVQSAIGKEVAFLATILARHVTAAELLRQPTLKDKLKKGARPEMASAFLLLYPVVMAADILLQRAQEVPVGEDQLAHLEIAREIARRFNARYGEVFPLPRAPQLESLRILSLVGEGKMSKSVPEGAIFLTDSPASAAKKIRGAQTATEGIMSESLKSHMLLVKEIAQNETATERIDDILAAHMRGEQVMGEFKKLMAEVVVAFLEGFQAKRAEIARDPSFIPHVLEEGTKVARAGAEETLALVHKALFKHR